MKFIFRRNKASPAITVADSRSPSLIEWHLATTGRLIEYWVRFDIASYGKPVEQEIDDPKGALESFIRGVEAAFGGDVADEFKKLKVKLRKVAGTPEAE
jgi:hypothetical protein